MVHSKTRFPRVSPDEEWIRPETLARHLVGRWLLLWAVVSMLFSVTLADYSTISHERLYSGELIQIAGGLVIAAAIILWKWRQTGFPRYGTATLRSWLFLTLLLCWLGFFFSWRFLNCWLDSSQPKLQKVELLEKWVSSGKGTKYYFRTTDWKDPHATMEFWVRFSPYETHKVGDIISLTVKKGFLGQEWLQAVT